MHAFKITSVSLTSLAIGEWFTLTVSDLERIATNLLGERLGRSWVRHGDSRVAIANLKLGSIASKIPLELDALAVEARQALATGGRDSALRAAAFYHLRFENIHPLREGNGRVGRTILAAQVQQVLGIPIEETLRQINLHENDYKMVFANGNQEIMFELMLDVIARLSGRVVEEGSAVLPASILPLYPDRRPLIKNPDQQVRPLSPQVRKAPRGGQRFRRFR